MKVTRDGDWKSAAPVKPTITKIDFRKHNNDGELMLDNSGQEQCETEDHKLEQIKCDFEAKKIECTEELRSHNNKL